MGIEIVEIGAEVEFTPTMLKEAWDAVFADNDETDPLEVLEAVVVLREWLRITEEGEITLARGAGKSWAEIGKALGMTRQSAWEQFSDTTR